MTYDCLLEREAWLGGGGHTMGGGGGPATRRRGTIYGVEVRAFRSLFAMITPQDILQDEEQTPRHKKERSASGLREAAPAHSPLRG